MTKKILQPAGMPVPGAYANGILVDGTAYLAGQVGVDDKGNCPADIEGQTDQAFDNIARVLAEAGMTLKDIVKSTVYLTDLADYAAFAAARGKHLGDHRPASTLVVVSALIQPQFKLEIDVTAAAG
ncbi:MAG: RidA family protein [Alphaproteobacteria bacterium]|nr:RidA family protein [Alphaproteobacteria bacterium]